MDGRSIKGNAMPIMTLERGGVLDIDHGFIPDQRLGPIRKWTHDKLGWHDWHKAFTGTVHQYLVCSQCGKRRIELAPPGSVWSPVDWWWLNAKPEDRRPTIDSPPPRPRK